MKKYTMEDFKREKIAVTFANEDEQKRFLHECERAGLKSRTGRNPTAITQSYECPVTAAFDKPCALSFWDSYKGRATDEADAKSDGFSLVPFSAFDFAQPAPAPSALNPLWAGIVTDATTAAEVNAMIDQLRRIRYDKRQKEAPAPEYDEVKRPAYKGDTIKLIEEPSSCFKSKYHKGDIVKIEEYGILPSVRAMDGCSWTGFFQNEYVVLVPRKKEA